MKFQIIEDVGQDIKTVENNSVMLVEFHIYTPDHSQPEADQYVAQLEQRITAFGAENSEQTNESGKKYSMFRMTNKKFQAVSQISEFFQNEFTDFVKLLDPIWKASNNFVRVVIVTEGQPPKRIPGKLYTLLSQSDYQDMLLELKGE